MTDELRLVVQLLTPILLALGLFILNRVFTRISALEDTLKQFDRDCESRHSKMWEVIREQEGKVSRIQGRINGWFRVER